MSDPRPAGPRKIGGVDVPPQEERIDRGQANPEGLASALARIEALEKKTAAQEKRIEALLRELRERIGDRRAYQV